MKRLFLMLLILNIGLPAFAAAVGGTHPVTDGSLVALAFEYDYIYDRDLKGSGISNANISLQNTAYARLTFKANDYIHIYVKGGISNFRTDVQLDNGNRLEADYKTGIYTGIGAKVLYQFLPKVTLAVDNQLNWWRCDTSKISYIGTVASDESGHRSSWEYQLAGILSYTIDYQELLNPIQGEWPIFAPYIGVKYAHLRIDSAASATSGGTDIPIPDNYRNKNSAGLVGGLDITLKSLGGFSFNIEGRILDETAISGYLQYNF